ncbi:MAG TPA: hypothetical protein VFE46_11925 [Pirellulales bacterium]|jgi:hypothetical protein|nr:hypothetical protein [Pirellulales bacterium]
MKFTVVCDEEVQSQLLGIWLNASDPNAVTVAANEIERLLCEQPTQAATHVSEGLWKLTSPPLSALFEVRNADRVVVIASFSRSRMG